MRHVNVKHKHFVQICDRIVVCVVFSRHSFLAEIDNNSKAKKTYAFFYDSASLFNENFLDGR